MFYHDIRVLFIMFAEFFFSPQLPFNRISQASENFIHYILYHLILCVYIILIKILILIKISEWKPVFLVCFSSKKYIMSMNYSFCQSMYIQVY